MLTKFDSKSIRVKGLSFHPKRPWILASLHNGVIQLWDYRIGTLLDRYEEHEGPVRGIDFHRSQPLFVSGGDDYKIKVWNYKLRRCLFTLLGHLDYIRTVQFHHEYPWIVSASDDQTIRVWNWQSRTCLSVLSGHNHYVMCAQFHPREDLIVSASLDQTVRVWDTSGLRRKTVRGTVPDADTSANRGGQADIFGAQDAVVKYVLEGHDRGCNWASFHPTQNFIVSGADDRQIKLWRMSESKAWEMDTLRGHANNVSCVLFHPRHELVISNSEDRSIRVWDIQKRVCISTFRREADRFWMLALHAEQNLIAAGHDSGMVVFKLERERPAYAHALGSLYYIKDRYLRRAVLGTGSDVPLLVLRGRAPGLGHAPRTLYVNTFNPQGDEFLVMTNVEGGTWELYTMTGNGADAEPVKGTGITALFTARNKFAILEKSRQITVRGMAASDTGKRIKPPYPNADMMFPSSTSGRVLVRADDRVCLFELSSRKVIAEIAGVSVKYAIWNSEGSMVALLGKHTVVLADRDLTQLSAVSETVRVKSGAWDEHGVFIYTTINHVKYLLPMTVTAAASQAQQAKAAAAEGKTADGAEKASAPATLVISGIVRTLDVPVYAVEAKGTSLYVLDRDAKAKTLTIDPTEHTFKLALARRQFERVLNIIKGARLCGNAVLSFLQKAGYPEIALLFVEDDGTRFHLALQCGNLDIAAKAAKAMSAAGHSGAEDAWNKLAVEALKVGSVELAELAYQNTRALEKLSFLYAVSGQKEKLGKMLQIAQARGDSQSRFHNALLVGDAAERVKVLEGAGQTALAYLTAASHGMEEDAGRLRGYLEQAGLPVPDVPAHARPLQPAQPTSSVQGSFVRAAAPPKRQGLDLAAIAAAAAEAGAAEASGDGSGAAERASAAAAAAMEAARLAAAREEEERKREAAAAAEEEGEGGEGGGGWEDDLDLGDDKGKEGGGGWGDEDDLGLDVAAQALDATVKAKTDAASKVAAAEASGAVLPTAGTSVPSAWVTGSPLAGDHVAAGSFETAMSLLNRQIGIVNFAPMKSIFLSVYAGARGSLPTYPGLPPVQAYFARADEAGGVPVKDAALPAVVVSLPLLQERIARVHTCFTDGKFTEALNVLDTLFSLLPLAVARTKEEVDAIKGILRAATEYKLAVRIMATSKSHDQADGVRQVELAAYMTHCALEPPHLVLALNLAMSMAYKHQNFIHAAAFARRMLELPEANSAKNATLAAKAKKVLQLSEAQARNALKVDYDERTPFSLCAASLTPMYKGSGLETLRSPYSGAAYKAEYRGTTCVVDGMASVGVETIGLVVAPAAVAGAAEGKSPVYGKR